MKKTNGAMGYKRCWCAVNVPRGRRRATPTHAHVPRRYHPYFARVPGQPAAGQCIRLAASVAVLSTVLVAAPILLATGGSIGIARSRRSAARVAVVVVAPTTAVTTTSASVAVVAARRVAISARTIIVATAITALVATIAIAGAAVAATVRVITTTVAAATIVVAITVTSAAGRAPEILCRPINKAHTASKGKVNTTLWRAKVFAGGWGAWLGATSLLNAQSPSVDLLALQTLLCGVGLLAGHHVDEAEAARFTRVRIAHDVALLNLSVLFEQTCDIGFAQTRMDTSDKEVGALIAGRFLVFLRGRLRGTTMAP